MSAYVGSSKNLKDLKDLHQRILETLGLCWEHLKPEGPKESRTERKGEVVAYGGRIHNL